ncbi:hypothetical protein vseg_012387 [Gypsophila vaccaria]
MDGAKVSRGLPDELIIEILSKLSMKDLSICNCVSQLWRDSFTIQAFKRRHSTSSDVIGVNGMIRVLYHPLSSSTSNQFELLTFEIPSKYNKNNDINTSILEGQLRTLPLRLLKFDWCSNIYHGLACIYNLWFDSRSDLPIILYSTRVNAWVVLPTSRNYGNFSDLGSKNQRCFIGFDTLRTEYKIVRVITYYETTSYETLVLGSRSWNRIDNVKVPSSLLVGWRPIYENGFCLDGVIFWMHLSVVTHGNHSHTVVAFDLNHEEFRVFNLDKILTESSFTSRECYLAALRGCPTVLAWQPHNHDEVLVCTFSDCKMTSVAWSKRIATRGFYPRTCVSQSRLVVMCKRSTTMKEDVYFLCTDLENDTRWEIRIKN